jgi:signal peptidase I
MKNTDPRLVNVRRIAVFFDVVKILFVAVLLVGLIRIFVAQPFVVSGDSMVPAFQSGDYLIVNELAYKLHVPQRGDIAIFHYPVDPSLFFIKRIIGVPGDTVVVLGGSIFVKTKEGNTEKLLNEPYISVADVTQEVGTTTLGSDEYFVLGDNRNASFDSRIWGPVPSRNIVGRAVARLYPFTGLSLFPGSYTFPSVASTTHTK